MVKRLCLWVSLLITVTAAPADALDKISVIHSSVGGSQAVLFVTRDAKIFEKNGLEVEIFFVAGGPSAINSLLSGDVQVAILAGPAAVSAKFQGADTAIIMGLIHTMDHVIFSRPTIKKPDDLKNKKIAVSRLASADDFALRYALTKWKLNPATDVTILPLGEQRARLTALKEGVVDATLLQPPLTAVARKQGLTELTALADLGIDYLGTSVVTTHSLIKTQEDLIRRFVKAFVEGIHFYKTNKAASLVSITKFMKLEDPEAVEETYKQYALKLTPRVPYPTVKGVQTILEDMAKTDAKAKTAKPADFTEPRFVRELEESGAITALYGR